MLRIRPVLLALVVLTLLPGLALAGPKLELRELGGCQFPILQGAKMDSEVASTFEEGNLVLQTREAQHSLFWFPGANAQMNDEVLGFYVKALTDGSGAWFGSEDAVWTDVDGNKAARLPIKITGEDQESTGMILIWASVSTGRYFMYILTPAMKGKSAVYDDATLTGLMTEAASMVSCEGAGKVAEPVAMLEPLPSGWWADEGDLPRLKYGRRDKKQTIVVWSGRWSASEFQCSDPAQTLFDRFMEDPSLSQTGEARVEVDNSDGTDGTVFCRVEASIDGWSDADGDRIFYTQWACPGLEDRMVAAVELVAGDLDDEGYLDPQSSAVCYDEMPEAPATPVIEISDEPKEQWVPKKKDKKKGRK
jgi:hypothetical protein